MLVALGAMQLSAATSVAGSPTSYAAAVVADGPSHYYRMGETSGTMAADSSGNNRHATYQGHGLYEPWVAGKHVQLGKPGGLAIDVDPSIYLPGMDYYDEARVYGELGSEAGLATANAPRTVEGWVKTTSGSFLVADWGSAATNQRFAVHVRGTTVVVDRGGGALSLPADRVLNDGAWHQVVVSFDGANAVLYVDGQRRSSAALGPLDTVATPPTVGFVNRHGGFGFLDEVAIYPGVLSDAQVAAHFEVSGNQRPNAPASVSAVASDNQATVSWSAVSVGVPPGQAPVDTYVVRALSGTTALRAVGVAGSKTR